MPKEAPIHAHTGKPRPWPKCVKCGDAMDPLGPGVSVGLFSRACTGCGKALLAEQRRKIDAFMAEADSRGFEVYTEMDSITGRTQLVARPREEDENQDVRETDDESEVGPGEAGSGRLESGAGEDCEEAAEQPEEAAEQPEEAAEQPEEAPGEEPGRADPPGGEARDRREQRDHLGRGSGGEEHGGDPGEHGVASDVPAFREHEESGQVEEEPPEEDRPPGARSEAAGGSEDAQLVHDGPVVKENS